MKKYEYVTIKVGGILGAFSEQHRKIIDEYAAKGYRYAGFVPVDINSGGVITKPDLIFGLEQ